MSLDVNSSLDLNRTDSALDLSPSVSVPADRQMETGHVPTSRKAARSKHRPARPPKSRTLSIIAAPRDQPAAYRWRNGIDYTNVIWLGMLHVIALAAPFCFSWAGLVTLIIFHWLTGSIGVCMGYHRQLTHGSFATYRPIRWLLAFIGGLSGEGSALMWVATHRMHHVLSDQEGDPHSPRDGGWWSHMFWLSPNLGTKYHREMLERYAPDMLKDPGIRILHKLFLPSHFFVGGLMYLVGYLIGGVATGVSMVIWGTFLRLVLVLHVTWFVNSASHIWGYRTYETTDDSRNNWWVGLLAYGEGWHNNHHAFQRMARHGHRWWEIDVTYWAIWSMEKVGLAWDVVHDVPQRQKALKHADRRRVRAR